MTLEILIEKHKDYYKKIPKNTEIFLGKQFSEWSVMAQLTILNKVNNPNSRFIELQLNK